MYNTESYYFFLSIDFDSRYQLIKFRTTGQIHTVFLVYAKSVLFYISILKPARFRGKQLLLSKN